MQRLPIISRNNLGANQTDVGSSTLKDLIKKQASSLFSTQSPPQPSYTESNGTHSVQTFCYLPKELSTRKLGKKTLVLDLDDTLVRSSFKPIKNPDFTLTINISNLPNQTMNQKLYICKRPYCDEFLEVIAQSYEVVMFTASL